MTDKTPEPNLALDQFVDGLRRQIRASVGQLQHELDSARDTKQKSLPVFMLDEVEVTVDAQIDEKVAGKLSVGGEVELAPKLLFIPLGKAAAKAEAEGSGESGSAHSTKVRILLRPKMASWDKDGWNVSSDIFLESPDSNR
ncbi:MAG: hypothetical protein AAGD38_23360 [Acidobacteriota bacterium]